jgi:hypothetical protein
MNKKNISFLLFASIAFNIFLVAFCAGKISMLPINLMPMHPFPPFFETAMPPHPPFILPEMALSKEEMKEEARFARDHFQKIQDLRYKFAKDIAQKDLTAEQITAHFDSIEFVLDDLKKHIKERMSSKISKMSLEERRRFASQFMDISKEKTIHH